MGFLRNFNADIVHGFGRKQNALVQCRKEILSILRTTEMNNGGNGCMKKVRQLVTTTTTTTIKNRETGEDSLKNFFNKKKGNNINISNIHRFNQISSMGIATKLISIPMSGTMNSTIRNANDKSAIIKDSLFYFKSKRNESGNSQTKEKQTNWKPDASLERRYALALYNICKKKNILPTMIKDIQYLQKNVTKNTEANNFFNMPIVSQEDKIKALTRICKKNNPSNEIIINFISFVFKQGRFKDLENIFASFFKIIEEEKDVMQCVVYTARPLTEDKKKAVYNKIHEISKGVYQPKIRYEVDPSILGGIIFHVGPNVYDFSTRERTNQIMSHLT